MQPEVLEAGGRGAHRAVAEVRERVAAPQRERAREQLVRVSQERAVARASASSRSNRATSSSSGSTQHAVRVAPRLEPVGADRTAQPVDVDLQRADRARRRLVAPERVDEPLARHGRAAPQQQLREQRALLRAAERNRTTLADHLDWPQQPKFHLTLPRLSEPQADLKRLLRW